jgi:hypothetical protein
MVSNKAHYEGALLKEGKQEIVGRGEDSNRYEAEEDEGRK